MTTRGVLSSVLGFLSARKSKKQPPHGIILVIPVETLLDHDYSCIQVLSQKNKKFYRTTVVTLTS